jgi:methyl-accepting chemotaxis protein
MTGEEMERAIEFLLQSQANHQVRLDQLTQQIAETNRIVQLQADTQSQFIQIVTSSMEALAASQRRTDERFKKTDERLSRTDEQLSRTDEQLSRTDEQLSKTDERLDRLAGIVERHIVEGHGDS